MPTKKFRTKERYEALHRMQQAGDTEGVRRWYFGVFINTMRQMAGLTQEGAAARAGLTRVQWSRIENGHDLPKKSNLSAIADAINVDIAGLYRRAGYALPDDLKLYDVKRAKRDLEVSLLESTSLAEFLIDMQIVWQQFQLQRLGKNFRFYIDPGYAQVLEVLYEKFSLKQRISLAQAILQSSPEGELPRDNIGPHWVLDRLDMWVEEFVVGEVEDKDRGGDILERFRIACAALTGS